MTPEPMPDHALTYVTATAAQTHALAAAFARHLQAGDVLRLHGEMGAGKTQFVRGLARGLGLREDSVSSPTFTLVQEYWPADPTLGGLVLVHVDAYRMESATQAEGLGLEEALDGAILALEWPERVEALDLPQGWQLHLHHAPNGRHIRMVATGQSADRMHEAAWQALALDLDTALKTASP